MSTPESVNFLLFSTLSAPFHSRFHTTSLHITEAVHTFIVGSAVYLAKSSPPPMMTLSLILRPSCTYHTDTHSTHNTTHHISDKKQQNMYWRTRSHPAVLLVHSSPLQPAARLSSLVEHRLPPCTRPHHTQTQPPHHRVRAAVQSNQPEHITGGTMMPTPVSLGADSSSTTSNRFLHMHHCDPIL
jgi:hypothetical protein